ncbi:MAG: GDSL-type esterase/lipase family protein [Phycisphaerales bacterium]|nr:GDSL-type esterase/lipase family protein [Phycisphaerales bacterium]
MVLYLASGETLYIGGGILILMVILSYWMQSWWGMRVRNFVGIMGLVLMGVSCTPLPWVLYGGVAAGFVGWFVVWNRAGKNTRWKWVRTGTAVGLAVIVMAVMAMEWPHRNGQILLQEQHDHLTVIGDSISAGIGGGPTWPTIYAIKMGVRVKNLSRAGMVTGDAMAMAKQIGPEDTLVLVELGGNDLLMDVAAAEFERNLDRLLGAIAMPGRRVVMMELPLLPHKMLFGRIQRRLAEKYGVSLIPKRYFIQVLSGGGATSDGLHLSKAGAVKMGELVDRFVGQTLMRQSTSFPFSRPLRYHMLHHSLNWGVSWNGNSPLRNVFIFVSSPGNRRITRLCRSWQSGRNSGTT